MGGFICFLVAIVALLIWQNWGLIRLLPPIRWLIQGSVKMVETGEFRILKPAGFYQKPETSLVFFDTERKTGITGIIDGEQVHEELSYAYAVVSVCPGDNLESSRKCAKQFATEVLHEDDTTGETADKRLSLTVVQQTRLGLRIETTHTVVVSAACHKTYELRTSVIVSEKEKYGDAIAQIIQSFEVI